MFIVDFTRYLKTIDILDENEEPISYYTTIESLIVLYCLKLENKCKGATEPRMCQEYQKDTRGHSRELYKVTL